MKIAVFYHSRISGGCNVDSKLSIDPSWGRTLFQMQMNAVVESGLYEHANAIFIGLNGCENDRQFVADTMPDGSDLIYSPEGKSLLPTVLFMQLWARKNRDAYIFFHHAKGATHQGDALTTAWRECMTHHLVFGWEKCVTDLWDGKDAVGCHWLANRPNDPNASRWGGNSYFGGVFWWVMANYLAALPLVPPEPTDRHSWYLPELLIGCGNPIIKDYHPVFPTVYACQASALLK